eukprot:COSAG01_NODE_2206_length_8170_cov_70.537108_6_plen_175_part_00
MTTSCEVIELSKPMKINPKYGRLPLIWEGFPKEIEELIFLMSRELHSKKIYSYVQKKLNVEWHYHTMYKAIRESRITWCSPHPGRHFLSTTQGTGPFNHPLYNPNRRKKRWEPWYGTIPRFGPEYPQILGIRVDELSTRKNAQLRRVLDANTIGIVKGLRRLTKRELIVAILSI